MGIYKPGRPFKYVPATGTGSRPPEKPGLYRIRNAKGTIVYIGETCNLARRIREHVRSGKIPVSRRAPFSVEYQIADSRSNSCTRRLHERRKIAQHKPLLNRSKGGEGRIAVK